MTFAACMPCNGGLVFGADTDEFVGDMKRRVNKIFTLHDQPCVAMITGACANGDLMDTAADVVFYELKRQQPKDGDAVHSLLRQTMLRLYAEDFRVFQAKESRLQLLAGVRPYGESKAHAWSIHSTAVRRLKAAKLVGYGELLDYVMRQLYATRIPGELAVLIMIQLLAIAKNEVNFVGGDSCIAVLKEDGGWGVEHVRFSPEQDELYEMFMAFGKDLMLATGLSRTTDQDIEAMAHQFGRNLKYLHARLCSGSSASFREKLFSEPTQSDAQTSEDQW